MRDGPLRVGVKAIARALKTFDLAVTRWVLRRRGQRRYRLLGSCVGCGRCCERPSVAVGRVVWFVPSIRRVFLWWQRVVNGFELREADARFRVFGFRCTHFDASTKRCDSYASRPLMCRDYPVNLTFEATPTLFPECSYVVQDRKAEQLRASLIAAGVSGEKLEALERSLFLKGLPSPRERE